MSIEKCASCGKAYEADISTLFSDCCQECSAKFRRERELNRIKNNPNCFVYHGKAYTVGKEPSSEELHAHPNWYGFSGSAWKITPKNGEPFVTHNLYYNGEVELEDTCSLEEIK